MSSDKQVREGRTVKIIQSVNNFEKGVDHVRQRAERRGGQSRLASWRAVLVLVLVLLLLLLLVLVLVVLLAACDVGLRSCQVPANSQLRLRLKPKSFIRSPEKCLMPYS